MHPPIFDNFAIPKRTLRRYNPHWHASASESLPETGETVRHSVQYTHAECCDVTLTELRSELEALRSMRLLSGTNAIFARQMSMIQVSQHVFKLFHQSSLFISGQSEDGKEKTFSKAPEEEGVFHATPKHTEAVRPIKVASLTQRKTK